MTNKNVEYVRIEKGDMLLLVPTIRDGGWGLENSILWSLKEFEFKVFAYLDTRLVISSIMKERALVGLPFYDIDVDMYDPITYPDAMESLFRNRWDYAVMRQTYRYFDKLLPKFEKFIPSSFAVSCEWNNNTRDALEIYALNEWNQSKNRNDELGIQFSSYTEYSEKMIEDLIINVAECEKLPKDYKDFKPVKEEEKAVLSDHMIEKNNSFFLFKNGEIYCGMKHINPNVLEKCDWRFFAGEMIHPKGCNECNPGYKMRVEIPKGELKLFKHSLFKDYGIAGNNCYSISTQLINLIHSQWERIKKEVDNLEWIVFDSKYDDKRYRKGHYMAIQYLDKNWKEIKAQEISFKFDGDYIVQDKAELAKLL